MSTMGRVGYMGQVVNMGQEREYEVIHNLTFWFIQIITFLVIIRWLKKFVSLQIEDNSFANIIKTKKPCTHADLSQVFFCIFFQQKN